MPIPNPSVCVRAHTIYIYIVHSAQCTVSWVKVEKIGRASKVAIWPR